MRRAPFLMGVMCLALAFATLGCDENDNDASMFAATPLSGSNNVPPTGSAGGGSASFELNGSSVQYSVQLNGISGVTLAHLHSGGVGGSGPVRVQLFTHAGTGPINGTLISDSFAEGDVIGMSFSDLVDQMRSSQVYLDIHTLAFPDGEVRAQVRPLVQ